MSARGLPLPPPPPLPPPTVPNRSSSYTPPPPPPPLSSIGEQPAPPRHAAVVQVFEEPSAPFPTSPSSIIATRHEPLTVPSSVSEEDHTSGSVEPKEEPKSAVPSRSCWRKARFLSGHTIAEVGRSSWFDPRITLLFRLAVSALLISHLVFFSLHGDFSFRLYATWAYTGLTVASLLVLLCSLLEVLRIGDDDGEESARDEEEGEVPPFRSARGVEENGPDGKFSSLLAQVAAPTYQVFVTASLFGAVVFWAAIWPTQSGSVNYSVISLHVVAPALAFLDMILSLSIRFRLTYVPLFVLYNGAYVGALWAFFKLEDMYVYIFLDPSIQPRSHFIAKCAGLAAGVVAAALFPCILSITQDLCLLKRRVRKEEEAEKLDNSHDMTEDTATHSEFLSDSSQLAKERGAKKGSRRTSDGESNAQADMELEEHSLPRSSGTEEERLAFEAAHSSGGRLDRSSASISIGKQGALLKSGNRLLYRSSAPPRMGTSRSGSSLGSGDRMCRSDSGRSNWEEAGIETVQALPEEEYFRMPGVYTGGETEVVRLIPMPRSLSARQSSGLLSRSASGRLSRASSGLATRLDRSRSLGGRDESNARAVREDGV